MTNLITTVHDDAGIVEIWQTVSEKNDPQVQAGLKALYVACKAKKYTVAVFQSGEDDLYQRTRGLLVYNKKRCAELTVQRGKAAR